MEEAIHDAGNYGVLSHFSEYLPYYIRVRIAPMLTDDIRVYPNPDSPTHLALRELSASFLSVVVSNTVREA